MSAGDAKRLSIDRQRDEQPAVDIVLATYNGGRFLDDQLQSIQAQTHTNWRLLIRDDGSTDDTLQLLRAFAERHPDRVSLISDGRSRLGAAQNFSQLLECSTAPYTALSDQDDVWKPAHLERALATMTQTERTRGADAPILVHTDFEVVDENLRALANSGWRYGGVDPAEPREWRRLLSRNVVTGCSALLNAALRRKATPIPGEAVMHDWWLALVAARFGQIASVPEATLLYRQHGGNTLGAWQSTLARAAIRAITGERTALIQRVLKETSAQAAVFVSRYREQLDAAEVRLLEGYAGLPKASAFARRSFLLRNRLLQRGLLRKLSWLLSV